MVYTLFIKWFRKLFNPHFALSLLALGLVVVGILGLNVPSASAATGINKTLNYQGRLLNAAGAVIADGNYNMEFKIYQDGPGNVANDTGGTLKWTEDWLGVNSQAVTVKNGYFSISLGTINAFAAQVDWNQDTLWLSQTVVSGANATSTSCTTFALCNTGSEPEMLPMKRLSSAVYALNANQLQGLSASAFAQLAASTQTFTGTNTFSNAAGIVLSGTAASGGSLLQAGGALSSGSSSGTLIGANPASFSGDLINLQVANATKFKVDSAGVVTAGAANFSGNVTVTGTAASALVVKASTNGTTALVVDIQRSGGLSIARITDSGVLGLGSGSGTLVAGALGIADSNGNFGQIQTAANLGAARTYTLPNSSGTFCLDSGNCGSVMTLQAAYTNSTGSTTPEIKLDNTRNGIELQDADTTLGTSQNFLSLRGSNGGGLGNVRVGFGINGNIYMKPGSDVTNLLEVHKASNDAAIFMLDSSNGRVGINLGGGTGSPVAPSYSLDVSGIIAASSKVYTPEVDAASGTLTLGGTNATAINVGNGSITTAFTGNVTVASPATTGNGLAITANSLTSGTGLKVTSASNTAANTAWSANLFNVTNSQATTAVSTGRIAGLDVQFTQNASVLGNTETVANLAVAASASSPTDNTVSSILNLSNNDTATGNQITVTDGIKIGSLGGTGSMTNGIELDGGASAVTNGIKFSNVFGGNLIDSSYFTLSQGGNISMAGNLTMTSGTLSVAALPLGGITAAVISTGSNTNLGLAVQGVASQSGDLFMVRDSNSVNFIKVDAAGNDERISYIDTPYGGIGPYGNLLVNSEQLDLSGGTPPWTASSVTVTPDNTTAPDGTASADRLVVASGTGTLSQTYTTSTAGTYTFSVWLKQSSGSANTGLCIFAAGGATPSSCTATAVQPNANGWQRFSVTTTVSGTTTSVTARIVPGNGSSVTIYAWGAQLVLSSTPQVYTRTGATSTPQNLGVVANGSFQINATSGQATDLLRVVDGAGNFAIKVFPAGTIADFTKPTTTAATGAMELGSSATQSSNDINGVIGFLGNGVKHAQIAYAVGDGFYLCDSSAGSASGDYGQCSTRMNLYGNIGNFNNSVTTPTVNAGTVTNTSALNLQTTSGNIVINGAGILDIQDNATFAGTVTANSDVDMTFGGTENLAVTSDLAGTVDAVSVIATPSGTAGTTRGLFVQQANSANTNGLDNALVVDNADTNLAIGAALQVTNTGGGGYTNLLDTPSLDITGAGAITGATGVSSSGTIAFGGLSTNGFVKTTGGTGTLSVSAAVALGGSDVSGTLLAGNGGTGQSSYAVGDILYASTTSALSKLADVAVGSCLISGGVGVAPSWGGCGGTFTLAGTSGSNQTISAGDTLLIAAGTNITTTGAATDKVTIATVNNPVFSTSVTTPSVTAASGDLNLDSANGRIYLNGSTDISTNANLNIYSGTVSGGISTLTLQSQGTGGISLGVNAAAKTIDVGAVGTTAGATTLNLANSTGATQTVNVGSTQASSVTTINGGSGISLNGNVTVGSGKTFSGAGLTDCNAQNSKVLWDSATSLFSCGTDRASVSIRKSADQSRTSSTAMLNDSELTFAIGASDTYIIQLSLYSTYSTAGDIKYAITAPTGATCNFNSIDTDPSGSGWEMQNTGCGTVVNYGNSGGTETNNLITIDGTVANSTTAGSVTYQFSQMTSSGTATITKAGSSLVAYKVNGADLAEAYYTKDSTIGPGMVVSLDPSTPAGVAKSARPYDARVLGVISTNPGQVLADPHSGKTTGRPVMVALAGRIPVRVTTEGGVIHAGDFLTASSTAGMAMKASRAGEVIGKALEDFDGSRGGSQGIVLMFASQQWADPRDPDGDPLQADMLQSAGGEVNAAGLNVSGGAAVAGSLNVAGSVESKVLTVNGLATVDALNVKGKAQVSELAVSGNASVADISVGGHVTTQGAAPKVTATAAAGDKATASVDGNDVSGTVTVKTGATGVAAGDLVALAFNKPYERAPHVVVTPRGEISAMIQAYLSGSRETDFGIGALVVPKPNETYQFEYFVTQNK